MLVAKDTLREEQRAYIPCKSADAVPGGRLQKTFGKITISTPLKGVI